MIGRVYRIEDTLKLNIFYIGSTTKSLEERFKGHKSKYNTWLKNKTNTYCNGIFEYFEIYGINKFKIILLKEYNVKNNEELRKLEQKQIEKNGCCVNKIRAYTDKNDIGKPMTLFKVYEVEILDQSHLKDIRQRFTDRYCIYCKICKFDVYVGKKDLNYTHNKTQKHNRKEMYLEDIDIN